MKNERESPWCEVQLNQRQWANMPESAGLWAGVPTEDVAEARLRVNEETRLILHVVVISILTARQREVLELYFFGGCTQVEIASALGISQPTVSQHLFGKQRGARQVGGAFEKLRKAIHKAALRQRASATSTAQVIRALEERLDRARARQRANRRMAELAGTRQRHRGRKNNKKKPR